MVTVMTVPTNIVSHFLLQKGFVPPIQALANIADFLNSPALMAKIREVSKSFNSMITANTKENRCFWNKHTADRWGYKYNNDEMGGPFKRGIQDRIALYARLHRLENAALRHLILHNEAQIHIIDNNDCYYINDLSLKYLYEVEKTNPGWEYLLGMKALLHPSSSYNWLQDGFDSLRLSEKQGYKVGENRYEIAVKCLIRATHSSAGVALRNIQKDGFKDKNWEMALTRISSRQVNDYKNSTCCQKETAAMTQNTSSLLLPVEVIRHIFSFLKPKQVANFRATSQYFNTWELENSKTNQLFLDGLCIQRWGVDYIPPSAKDKYISVQDKIFLYSKLYQLEKAALRHLTLLDEAIWNRKFSDFSSVSSTILYEHIAGLSKRYLQGANPKVAWQYLYGKNMLKLDKHNNLDGLQYLEKAAAQGYKDAAAWLGQRWLEMSQLKDKKIGVEWLLKAVELKHPVSPLMVDPNLLLQAIQDGQWEKYIYLSWIYHADLGACQEALRQGIKRKNEEDSNELEAPAKKPKLENDK